MQKYRDGEADYVKLKLFLLSLRARAKEWSLYLPKISIYSWNKCKDIFGKYYAPTKIIQFRNIIMNFPKMTINTYLNHDFKKNVCLEIVHLMQ